MSDDTPRDDEQPRDEPTSTDDTGSREDEPEIPDGMPDPSAFGIDPDEMMRNPIGAAFKMLSNPEAMKAFEGFMSTPGAQKLLGQGMNSPMFQQMMQNNPMLRKMSEQAAQGGGIPGMGNLFGGMGAPQPEAWADDEDVEDDDDEVALDEPVLDLLTSPHGGPAYPESASVTSFDQLLSEMPEAARDRVIEIAETRATHHLGAKGIERLQSLADQKGLTRAVDLLVSQGAFIGEVAWYSIVKLEDEIEPWRFVDLARHALSSVTQPIGYRVPSFVNQLLAFLVDLDEARPQDIRHAVWSLSGQPVDGTDGVFEITWEDVDDLVGELSGAASDDDDDDEREPVEPRLMAALITGLVGWRELDLSERKRGFDQLIDGLPKSQRKPVLEVLAGVVGSNDELEGLRGTHLGGDLRRAIAEKATHDLGADRMLGIVEQSWQLEPPVDAWMGVLHALDVLYHDASAERRTAFFERATSSDDTALRHLAYRVAAAWEPHAWLERASEDADAGIRQWAEEESSTLR